MTRLGAESLAAALAAFVAVTPFAGLDDPSRSDKRDGVHGAAHAAPPTAGLSGVGMPDTGPGNLPVKPLTVIVTITGTPMTRKLRAEVAQLGAWLSTHHGRARLALVSGRHTTGLVEPSKIEQAPAARPIPAPSAFAYRTFATRAGQRLLVTIGPRHPARSPGAASLWLPERNGAPVVDAITLQDRQAITQPVDVRRRGVIAASAARAVISLAHLREVPSRAQR